MDLLVGPLGGEWGQLSHHKRQKLTSIRLKQKGGVDWLMHEGLRVRLLGQLSLCSAKPRLGSRLPVPQAGWAQRALLSPGVPQLQSGSGQAWGPPQAPSLSLWHLCARVCGPDFRAG